jgi:hypothetical protein
VYVKIWYDNEFVDTGDRILPISIGLVAEDGREFYGVNEIINDDRTDVGKAIRNDEWLMKNVVPHLPLGGGYGGKGWQFHPHGATFRSGFQLDGNSLDVMPIGMIRKHVKAFLDATPDTELWAWYGAYDHVMLAQLFGRMLSKPASMPMWTNDLKQLQVQCGVSDDELQANVLNDQPHNALADARWTRKAYHWLIEVKEMQEASA